jgi:hypothetical protein
MTAVHRATHDLFLAQRIARHVGPLRTFVHTHLSGREVFVMSSDRD